MGTVLLHRENVEEIAFATVPYGREGRELRSMFDEALDLTHYAGSCQRVGRCMRLAITRGSEWVGGVVLGSTFPNVKARDEALGLRSSVKDYRDRGLSSPWSRDNTKYWTALQTIVNHARTFVFPDYQGQGIGVEAHSILPTQGIHLWGRRYKGKVVALDTLCDSGDSGLFRRNGWSYVGRTKGFSADKSKPLMEGEDRLDLMNDVGLSYSGTRWEVWVRSLDGEV